MAVELAELTRSGIQLTSAGRPVDLVFEDAMNHPDVLRLLQPLPSTSSALKRTSEPKNHDPRKLPKGKSKGKGMSIRMPEALRMGLPIPPMAILSVLTIISGSVLVKSARWMLLCRAHVWQLRQEQGQLMPGRHL